MNIDKITKMALQYSLVPENDASCSNVYTNNRHNYNNSQTNAVVGELLQISHYQNTE
jgi:hypothetical protein